MNRLLFRLLAILICSVPFVSCSDDDEEVTMVTPTNTGEFVDQRDGETYHWVEYGGLQWLTENFRYDINSYPDCRNYIEPQDWVGYSENQYATRNRAKYGMYYTLEGALRACPEGWRLPSDEDWQRLEKALGMSESETARYDWRGGISQTMVTTKDNKTYISFLLGGYVTYHVYTNLRNGCIHKGDWGFYWTSTKDTTKEGDFYIYRKFAYNRKEICRQSMEPTNQLLSVRYVRDASH